MRRLIVARTLVVHASVRLVGGTREVIGGLHRETRSRGVTRLCSNCVPSPTNGFEAPVLTLDGTEFFGSSQNAIWHAVRANAAVPFSTPLVISELNDPSFKDMPDFISADACRLYFHRGSNTNFNALFVATRPPP